MKLLAIDTSTERASVALAIGEDFYTAEQGSLRQHAQLILPMIDGLLNDAQVSLKQLDGIIFGRGPGSFTGLRVACSIAKALAYAHDLPLYPVSSLAAVAEEVYYTQPSFSEASVLALLDARMQQLYWGCFSQSSFSPLEQVSAPEDVNVPNIPFIIAGVGIDTYASQFSPLLQTSMRFNIYPEASAMIRLVRRGLIPGIDASAALPVYVRELQFSKKQA